MSRAAFITSSGDPFVLLYNLSFFHIWRDEIDRLCICINSDVEKPVINELLAEVEKVSQSNDNKITTLFIPRNISFGQPINRLLEISDESHLLLLEDDAIIFKPGIVDANFKLIESREYDLLGSPRMSCPPNVASSLQAEFGLDYSGWGDKGPMFWPCFLWTSRELLNRTDRNFDPGDWGDTFTWTSVQLRRLTSKILEVPQYHCSPEDFQNFEDHRGVFDPLCSYMHIGSLSSGIENRILDVNNVPLKERTKGLGPVSLVCPGTEPEKIELEKRVVFWREAFKLSQTKFGEFGEQYCQGLGRLIKTCKLNRQRINKLSDMYLGVING